MKKSLLTLSSLIIPLSSASLLVSCFGTERAKPPLPHKYLDSYIIKTLKLDTIKTLAIKEIDGMYTINFDDFFSSKEALEEIKNLALNSEQSPEFRFLKEQDISKVSGDFDISKTTLNFSKTVRIVEPRFTESDIKFNRLILELHVFKEEKSNSVLKNTYKIELVNDFTISNLNDFKTIASNLTLTDFNIDPSIIKDINKANEIGILSSNNNLYRLAEFFNQSITIQKKVINNELLITIKINNLLFVKDLRTCL